MGSRLKSTFGNRGTRDIASASWLDNSAYNDVDPQTYAGEAGSFSSGGGGRSVANSALNFNPAAKSNNQTVSVTKPAGSYSNKSSTQSSQPSWTEQPFQSAAGIDTSSFASLGGTLAMAAGASTGVGLAAAGGGLAIDLILGAYERQKQQDELDRQRAAEANRQIREQQNQMRINAANARIDAITRGEQQRDKLSLQRQQRAQEFKQSISSIQALRSETQRRVNQTGR